MNANVQLAVIIAGILFFVMINVIALLTKFYKKVPQGNVWIRTGVGGTRVSFGGIVFIPIMHRLEAMDITAKKIELKHFGDRALRTKDGVYLDAQVGIVLRIEPSEESVLFAGQTYGVAKTGNQEELEKLFRDGFEESLSTSVRQFTWPEIDESLEPLKAEFFERIVNRLRGFVIDDISFGHLSKPSEPMEQHSTDKTQLYRN